LDFSSFFSRKDKKKPEFVPLGEAVKPKTKEQVIAAIHEAPLTEQRFENPPATEDIVVTEIESSFAPGIEDAAMLYANGRTEEAINVVKMFIQQSPDEDSLWLMLFDLYWVSRQQQEFEQLAMEYAVKREKSPPVWVSGAVCKVPGNTGSSGKVQVPDGQLFSLKGRLDQHMADRIQLLLEAASKGGIQLDLSGITEVTPEGCTLLQAALVKLQKQQSRLQIASGALVGLLQQYVANVKDSAPEQWLLLMQLYQLQGKQAEFEDLAIAFAVHFELSPPSWEAPKQVAQVVAEAIEAPPVSHAESDVFKMSGTITSASTAVFDEFKHFAASHPATELDMFDVDRIEFASVGLFMDALMALIPSGRQVTITGANMMVSVLLTVMGVDQMAKIVSRKLG